LIVADESNVPIILKEAVLNAEEGAE
jgi:hypothetical protein